MFATDAPIAPTTPTVAPAPTRADSPSAILALMAAMLDRVECGLVAVAEDGGLLHANRAARAELSCAGVLAIRGERVVAPANSDGWSRLLTEAAVGRRSRLLQLGGETDRLMLVATPGPAAADGRRSALILLGRREACSRLGLEMLARHHGLTMAESRVLSALLQRQTPREVAADHGVAMTTVRTQIRSLCEKLGVHGIDGLLLRATEVPPVMATC